MGRVSIIAVALVLMASSAQAQSKRSGMRFWNLTLYTLTSLSNSSLVPNFLSVVGLLRPEQSGQVLLVYGALPMLVTVPLSIFLLRHVDPRGAPIFGPASSATAHLLRTQLTHESRLA